MGAGFWGKHRTRLNTKSKGIWSREAKAAEATIWPRAHLSTDAEGAAPARPEPGRRRRDGERAGAAGRGAARPRAGEAPGRRGGRGWMRRHRRTRRGAGACFACCRARLTVALAAAADLGFGVFLTR